MVASRHALVTSADGDRLHVIAKVASFGEGDSLGRTVARQKQDFCLEESPGSMDKLPGNAWAPSGDGQCHRN